MQENIQKKDQLSMVKLKKIIPFGLALIIVFSIIILFERKKDPYNPNLDVSMEFDKLSEQAKLENKNILIEFGANWCLDCHALSDILQRNPVQSYMKSNYLLLAVDVGKFDRNLEFSKKFGDPIQSGIPALVIISPSGNLIISTNNGEFSHARGLKDHAILEFLTKWKK